MKKYVFTLAALFYAASPAHSDALDDIMDVSVLTGWRAADGTHMAALKIDLAPGWKTYWRQPGDVGIPPMFNWSGSQNLSGAAMLWPVPDVWHDAGMRSLGYAGTVILPILVQPNTSGQVRLNAAVDIGVCEEICIPVSLTLSATLPRQGRMDRVIAKAVSQQATPGMGDMTCVFAPAADGMSVTLTMPKPPHEAKTGVIEVQLPGIWISEPVMKTTGATLTMIADIITPTGQAIAVNRSAVVASIFADGNGVEYRGCRAG